MENKKDDKVKVSAAEQFCFGDAIKKPGDTFEVNPNELKQLLRLGVCELATDKPVKKKRPAATE